MELSRLSVMERLLHGSAAILAEVTEYGAVGVAAYIAIRSIVLGSWLFNNQGPHGILAATMVSLFLAYAVVSRCLKVKGAGSVERMAISAATTLSAIELYELFYNGGFLTLRSFLWLGNSLPFLSILVQQNTVLTILGFLVLFFLMFSGIRFMRLNRVFYADLVLSVVVFGAWIAVGYPQFFGNGCPNYVDCHPPYALQGYLFNTATKFLIDLLPATLYLPRSLRTLTDDVVQGWRLYFAPRKEES